MVELILRSSQPNLIMSSTTTPKTWGTTRKAQLDHLLDIILEAQGNDDHVIRLIAKAQGVASASDFCKYFRI